MVLDGSILKQMENMEEADIHQWTYGGGGGERGGRWGGDEKEVSSVNIYIHTSIQMNCCHE